MDELEPVGIQQVGEGAWITKSVRLPRRPINPCDIRGVADQARGCLND